MKKKTAALLLALIAGVWLLSRLPNPATDVGRLEPVEAVRLRMNREGILIQTDTGAWGFGSNLAEAVKMLKQARSREVFLETADKLLLLGDPANYPPEIYELFRPGCQLCRVTTEVDLKAAAEYLSVHRASTTLGEYRARGGTPQHLILTEGSGILVPEE